MEEKLIKSLGLSEKASKIYLSIILNGKLNLSDISKKTGIGKTTLYKHLDELLKKDYIRKTIVGKRMYYAGESPRKILTTLENKKRIFSEILPDLNESFSKNDSESKIEYYEGRETIAGIYDKMWREARYMKCFFSPEPYLKVLGERKSKEFIEGLQKKGVVVETITLGTQFCHDFFKDRRPQKVKFLPEGQTIPIDIVIFNKKVALISFKNETAIIIENNLVTESYENQFKFYWDNI